MEKVRFLFDVSIIVLYAAPATFLFFLGLFCLELSEETGRTVCSLTFLQPYHDLFRGSYPIELPFFVLAVPISWMMQTIYGPLDAPLWPLSVIFIGVSMVALTAFLGGIGFRIMSLSEGLAATKKDWFGFLILGFSILIFLASL